MRICVLRKVAVLAPNIPALYELHFAVPMAGAVLSALNVHLDSAMVSVLLTSSEAKLLFVDYQLIEVAKGALRILSEKGIRPPSLVLIPEPQGWISGAKVEASVSEFVEYEALVAAGESGFVVLRPNDECDPIALNYTLETTSSPKGVAYSHREAYLNSMAAILLNEMQSSPVYLWTVPMFHCNGWCLTWGMAAQGGTNVCLRNVTSKGIFDSIATHSVTHMGGAPAVLNMIVNATETERRLVLGKVRVMTGAAPPPPEVLFEMEDQGFSIIYERGVVGTYEPETVGGRSQKASPSPSPAAWLVKEDLALMSTWCLASKEPDRNRKGASLWIRVHNLLQEAENLEGISVKSREAMRCRWRRLDENVKKWVTAYEEASRKRTGMSKRDIEEEAHAIYETKRGNRFQNLVVFNEVMSKHPRWEIKLDQDSTHAHPENKEGNEESGDNSKRSRTNENGEYTIPSTPGTPTSGCSINPRLTNGDNSENKGKRKASEPSSTNEAVAEIRALIHPINGDNAENNVKRKASESSSTNEVAAEIRAPMAIIHPSNGDNAKSEGKHKESESSSTNEVAAEIRALRLIVENGIDVMRELGSTRIDLELKREQRKAMKMNQVLLNTLLAKDHLTPTDEEMKRQLMAIVFKQ